VRFQKLVLLLIPMLLLAACGRKAKVPQSQTAIPRPIGWTETGIASWYGHPYHGRRAANGEVYDMEKMTAAHKTLPFETWVRVLNLTNSRKVDVRITDRGPFIDGRIIDLSRAAAEHIAMIGPGISKVRLEVIKPPVEHAPVSVVRFAVQVASFREPEPAEQMRREMETRYGFARVMQAVVDNADVWRVLVGSEAERRKADELARRIRADAVRDAFVVPLTD